MKKTALLMVCVIVLLVSYIVISKKTVDKTDSKIEYLKKVLTNLEQIKSATYVSTSSAYAPGDTSAIYVVDQYIKEYINSADTFVGASFVNLLIEDTNTMASCYDGKIRTLIYEEEKRIVIDSFKINPYPFRVVGTPFFTMAKYLLDYFLTTKDSLLIESTNFEDSIQYSFSIFDTVVEIIGNQIVYFPALYGSYKGDISKYDIWINKLDGLPYRIKRDLPHDISVEAIKNVRFNHINIEDFVASDYFPSGYKIQQYSRGKRIKKSDFEGKPAPNWLLNDAENNTFELAKLKSKVILLEFTSVSCGPCLMPIPFLKQLVTEYDKADFDFVSIEAFAKNKIVLKKYQERNDFKYKFLMSNKEVTKSYGVQAVPVFFILDENRIIRKVFSGYGKGTTDKEIRDAINELI